MNRGGLTDNKDLVRSMLYTFYFNNHLSNNGGDQLLLLSNYLLNLNNFTQQKFLPKNRDEMNRVIRRDISLFKFQEITIEWPNEWQMNKWNQFNKPDNIKLRIRNIIEEISLKFIDPLIMFGWKDHVHLQTFSQYHNNIRCYSVLMSSIWAENTSKLMKEKNSNGILIPIILYYDEVSFGKSRMAAATPVMVTLSNFSDTLMRKYFGKLCISYIPHFRDISETSVLSHLVDVCDMNITSAKK